MRLLPDTHTHTTPGSLILSGLPMCRMCCPTVFPFTRDVTRRLLSQWPPLNSSLPSWDATNSPAVTSTPGAKGPERERWVLGEEGEKEEERTEGLRA